MCTTSVRPHPQHLWAHASDRPPVTLKPWDIIIVLHRFVTALGRQKCSQIIDMLYSIHSSCATRAFSRDTRIRFWHTYPCSSRDAQVFHDLLKRRGLLRLFLVVKGDFLAKFSWIVWGRHLPFFSKTQSVAWDALCAAAAASSREELWALESRDSPLEERLIDKTNKQAHQDLH